MKKAAFIFLLFLCGWGCTISGRSDGSCTTDADCFQGEQCLNQQCQTASDVGLDVADLVIVDGPADAETGPDIAKDVSPDSPLCEVGSVRCSSTSEVEREICQETDAGFEWKAYTSCEESKICEEADCVCEVDCSTQSVKRCKSGAIQECNLTLECPNYETSLDCTTRITGASLNCDSDHDYYFCGGTSARVNSMTTGDQSLSIGEWSYVNSPYFGNLQAVTGGFVISWTTFNGSNRNIYYRQFNTKGEAVSSDIQVSPTSDFGYGPSLAVVNDNKLLIVWTSGIGFKKPFLRTIPLDPPSLSAITTLDTYGFWPRIVPLSGGNFVIAWFHNFPDSVKIGKFNSNGHTVVPIYRFSEVTQLNNAFFAIEPLPNNQFALIWDFPDPSLYKRNIRFRVLDASGDIVPTGITRDVVSQYQSHTSGAPSNSFACGPYSTRMADGRFIVGWWARTSSSPLNFHFYIRFFNPQGESVSSTLQVSQTPFDPGPYFKLPTSSMTVLKDTRLVIFWWREGNHLIRLLDSQANFITDEVPIDGNYEPGNAITPIFDKTVFVAWNSWENDTGAEVYGKILYFP